MAEIFEKEKVYCKHLILLFGRKDSMFVGKIMNKSKHNLVDIAFN